MLFIKFSKIQFKKKTRTDEKKNYSKFRYESFYGLCVLKNSFPNYLKKYQDKISP
jgi:hypothetical protein